MLDLWLRIVAALLAVSLAAVVAVAGPMWLYVTTGSPWSWLALAVTIPVAASIAVVAVVAIGDA